MSVAQFVLPSRSEHYTHPPCFSMQTNIYVYIYVYMYIYVCTYMYIYIYIYIWWRPFSDGHLRAGGRKNHKFPAWFRCGQFCSGWWNLGHDAVSKGSHHAWNRANLLKEQHAGDGEADDSHLFLKGTRGGREGGASGRTSNLLSPPGGGVVILHLAAEGC